MEEIFGELIEVIQKSNAFSWKEVISMMSVIVSWITIWFCLRRGQRTTAPTYRSLLN